MAIIENSRVDIPVNITYTNLAEFNNHLQTIVAGVNTIAESTNTAVQRFRDLSGAAAQIPGSISYAAEEAGQLKNEMDSIATDYDSIMQDRKNGNFNVNRNEDDSVVIKRFETRLNALQQRIQTLAQFNDATKAENGLFNNISKKYSAAIGTLSGREDSQKLYGLFNQLVSEIKVGTSDSKVGESTYSKELYEAKSQQGGARSSSYGQEKFVGKILTQTKNESVDYNTVYGRAAAIVKQMNLGEGTKAIIEGAVAAAMAPIKTFDFKVLGAKAADATKYGGLSDTQVGRALAKNIQTQQRAATIFQDTLFEDLYAKQGNTDTFRKAFGETPRTFSKAGKRAFGRLIESNPLFSNLIFNKRAEHAGQFIGSRDISDTYTADDFINNFVQPLITSWETYAGKGIKSPVEEAKRLLGREVGFYGLENETSSKVEHLLPKIYKRSLTGSAGQAVSALIELSNIISNKDYFTEASEELTPGTFSVNRGTARRLASVNAIETNISNGKQHNQKIALNESSFGRFLGLFNEGSEYSDQDIVKFIKLGYINQNDEDKQRVNDLVTKYIRGDSEDGYMFAGVHGTGANQSMRLVKRDKLLEAGRAIAAVQKIAANNNATIDDITDSEAIAAVFNGVDITDIDKVKEAASTSGKGISEFISGLMDKVNKQWTPNATDYAAPVYSKFYKDGKLDRKAITDFVNEQVEAQRGHAYIIDAKREGEELLNGQIISFGASGENVQFRGSQGVKGSAISYSAAKGEALKRQLRNTGIAVKDDVVMLPGGTQVNFAEFEKAVNNGGVTLYDRSTIKNEQALAGGDELTRFLVLSALMPGGSVRDYDADSSAKGIGAQAMNTMKLNSKFMDVYSQMVEKRIAEMVTPTGMIKHVFGDPNSLMHKGLTGQLGMSGIEFFAANEQGIMRQVETSIESVRENFAHGFFQNVDENTNVSEGRVARNNIYQTILSAGLDKYSEQFNKLDEDKQKELNEEFLALRNKRKEEITVKNPSVLDGEIKAFAKKAFGDNVSEDFPDVVKYLFAVSDYMEDKEGKLNIGDLADIAALKGIDKAGFYLPKGMVDTLNYESGMGVYQRSPSGIGQLIARLNMATMYQRMAGEAGVELTKGIMNFTDEDLEFLSSADFDGDMVKAIIARSGMFTGDPAEFFRRNKITNAKGLEDFLKATIEKGDSDITPASFLLSAITSENAFNNLGVEGGYMGILNRYKDAVKKMVTPQDPKAAGLSSEQEITDYIMRASRAVSGMGFSSAVSSSATMLDLLDPENRDAVIAAIESNHLYDIWTTFAKRPMDVSASKEMQKVLGLGDEHSKIANLTKGMFDVKRVRDEITGLRYYADSQGMPIKDEDVLEYVTSNGAKARVNLGGLRSEKTNGALSIDRLNFVSRHTSANVLGALVASLAGGAAQTAEDQIITRALTSERANGGVGYGVLDELINKTAANDYEGKTKDIEAVKRLVNNSRALKANFGGAVTMLSDETMEALTLQMAEAQRGLQRLVENTNSESIDFLKDSDGKLIQGADKKYLLQQIGSRLGFNETLAMLNARRLKKDPTNLIDDPILGMDFTEGGLQLQLMMDGYNAEDATRLAKSIRAADKSFDIIDKTGLKELRDADESVFLTAVRESQDTYRTNDTDRDKIIGRIKARNQGISDEAAAARADAIVEAFNNQSKDKINLTDAAIEQVSEIAAISEASKEDTQKAIALLAENMRKEQLNAQKNNLRAINGSSWSSLGKYMALSVLEKNGYTGEGIDLKSLLGVETVYRNGEEKSGELFDFNPAYYDRSSNKPVVQLANVFNKLLEGEQSPDNEYIKLGNAKHDTFKAVFNPGKEPVDIDEFRNQYFKQLQANFARIEGLEFEAGHAVASNENQKELADKINKSVQQDIGVLYGIYESLYADGVEWILSENRTKNGQLSDTVIRDGNKLKYSIDAAYKKDNTLHLVDFKSSDNGAEDALWQMIDYYGSISASENIPDELRDFFDDNGDLKEGKEFFAESFNMNNGSTFGIKINQSVIDKMKQIRTEGSALRDKILSPTDNAEFEKLLAFVTSYGGSDLSSAVMQKNFDDAKNSTAGIMGFANLPRETVEQFKQAEELEKLAGGVKQAYSKIMAPYFTEERVDKQKSMQDSVQEYLKNNTSKSAIELISSLGNAEYIYEKTNKNLIDLFGQKRTEAIRNELSNTRANTFANAQNILASNIRGKIEGINSSAQNIIAGEDLNKKNSEARASLIQQRNDLQNDIANMPSSLNALRKLYENKIGGKASKDLNASELQKELAEKLAATKENVDAAIQYTLDQSLSSVDKAIASISKTINGKNSVTTFDDSINAKLAETKVKIARAQQTLENLKKDFTDDAEITKILDERIKALEELEANTTKESITATSQQDYQKKLNQYYRAGRHSFTASDIDDQFLKLEEKRDEMITGLTTNGYTADQIKSETEKIEASYKRQRDALSKSLSGKAMDDAYDVIRDYGNRTPDIQKRLGILTDRITTKVIEVIDEIDEALASEKLNPEDKHKLEQRQEDIKKNLLTPDANGTIKIGEETFSLNSLVRDNQAELLKIADDRNKRAWANGLAQFGQKTSISLGMNPYGDNAKTIELNQSLNQIDSIRETMIKTGDYDDTMRQTLANLEEDQRDIINDKYERLAPAYEKFKTSKEAYEDQQITRLNDRQGITLERKNSSEMQDLAFKQDQELWQFEQENAELDKEEYERKKDRLLKRQEEEKNRLEFIQKSNVEIDKYQTEINDENINFEKESLKDYVSVYDKIENQKKHTRKINEAQRNVLKENFNQGKFTEEEYNRQIAKLNASDEMADMRADKQKRDFEFNNSYLVNNAKLQTAQMQNRFDITDMQRRSRIYGSRVYSDYVQRYSELSNEKNSIDSQLLSLTNQKEKYEKEGNSTAANALKDQITTLEARRDELASQVENAKGLTGLINAAARSLAQTVNSVITRFSTQLLRKGFAEAKKYIVEMDSLYANIAAIKTTNDSTPSNYEMDKIRNYTVSAASELHTSAKNVATVEASLYRQGLSDEEVQDRTKSIIQFSTVTGVKVENATKQLTAAVKSGLVKSIEEAMDAMVALGDAAATTASEISAGMQKSAATAKVAGVSFGELTALLTMGTSNTQLSGSVVGTMLNTTFSRIRKVTSEGLSSSDGDVASINDTQKALKAVGLSIFEDEAAGTFKTATQIFRDIAGVWQDLSDVEKSAITYAVAGTRQTNTFSTFMEGISVDGGKQFDEYVSLAEDSAGITAKKYEVITDTIQTKLQDITNAFDGLVASLEASDMIKDVLGSIADFINMLGQTGGVAGLVGTVASVMGGASIAKLIVTALSSHPLVGLALGALGIGGSIIASSFKTEDPEYKKQKQIDENNARINRVYESSKENSSTINEYIESVSKIKNKNVDFKETLSGTSEDSQILNQIIEKTKLAFPELANAIDDATDSATGSFEKLIEVLNRASSSSDDFVKAQAKNVIFNTESAKTYGEKEGYVDKLVKQLNDYGFAVTKEQIMDPAFLKNLSSDQKFDFFGATHRMVSEGKENVPDYENASELGALNQWMDDRKIVFDDLFNNADAVQGTLVNFFLNKGEPVYTGKALSEAVVGELPQVFEALESYGWEKDSSVKHFEQYIGNDPTRFFGLSFNEIISSWLESIGFLENSTVAEAQTAVNNAKGVTDKYKFTDKNGVIFTFNTLDDEQIGREYYERLAYEEKNTQQAKAYNHDIDLEIKDVNEGADALKQIAEKNRAEAYARLNNQPVIEDTGYISYDDNYLKEISERGIKEEHEAKLAGFAADKETKIAAAEQARANALAAAESDNVNKTNAANAEYAARIEAERVRLEEIARSNNADVLSAKIGALQPIVDAALVGYEFGDDGTIDGRIKMFEEQMAQKDQVLQNIDAEGWTAINDFETRREIESFVSNRDNNVDPYKAERDILQKSISDKTSKVFELRDKAAFSWDPQSADWFNAEADKLEAELEKEQARFAELPILRSDEITEYWNSKIQQKVDEYKESVQDNIKQALAGATALKEIKNIKAENASFVPDIGNDLAAFSTALRAEYDSLIDGYNSEYMSAIDNINASTDAEITDIETEYDNNVNEENSAYTKEKTARIEKKFREFNKAKDIYLEGLIDDALGYATYEPLRIEQEYADKVAEINAAANASIENLNAGRVPVLGEGEVEYYTDENGNRLDNVAMGKYIRANGTDMDGNPILKDLRTQLRGKESSTATRDLRLQFASFMSQFEDFESFNEKMSSNIDLMDKYATIYATEDFADIAKEVENGTKSFGDLIDHVLNSANSLITYSSRLDAIKTMQDSTTKLNFFNKMAMPTGEYRSSDIQQLGNILGIDTTNFTPEMVNAFAANAYNNQLKEIQSFGMSQISSVQTSLKEFIPDEYKDELKDANTFEEFFSFVRRNNSGELPEQIQNAYALYQALVNSGFTFSDVGYNDDGEIISTVGYNPENNKYYSTDYEQQMYNVDASTDTERNVLAGAYSMIDTLSSPDITIDSFNEILKINQAWQDTINSSKEAADIIDDYREGIISAEEAAARLAETIGKTAKADANFNKNTGGLLESMANKRYAINHSNEKDSQDELAKLSGFSDYKTAKALGIGLDTLKKNAETSIDADIEDFQNLLNERTQVLEGYNNLDAIQVKMPDIDLTDGIIIDNVNMLEKLKGIVDDKTYQTLESFVGTGGSIKANITSEGETVKVTWTMASYTGGAGGGVKKSGGGGGSKKSAMDKLIDKLKREIAIQDHVIKMTQKDEALYESRGELTMFGKALEEENVLQLEKQKKLASSIDQIRAKMKGLKKDSDDWKKAVDQIMEFEEAIADSNKAVEDNTRKLRENQVAIRNTKTVVADMLREVFETQEQERRSMLQGNINLQNDIIEVLKDRYRTEAELVKSDLENKKAALQKEKDLINERLNARKSAEDTAAKYEQLAEYQKQLALISMDSTRTKDAAEMRRKIADLEKELAWKTAEDEAEAYSEGLQDQIDGIDDFITEKEKYDEEYLADNNNFADMADDILANGSKYIVDWLSKNNKEFRDATAEQQTAMIDGWVDTYNQMINYTERYNAEIEEILEGGIDKFLAKMMTSTQFITATAEEQLKMMDEWMQAFHNMDAAYNYNQNYNNQKGVINLNDYMKAVIGNGEYQLANEETQKKMTEQALNEWNNLDADLREGEYLRHIDNWLSGYGSSSSSSGSGSGGSGSSSSGTKYWYWGTDNAQHYTTNKDWANSHKMAGSNILTSEGKVRSAYFSAAATTTATDSGVHGYHFSYNGKTYSETGFKTKEQAAAAGKAEAYEVTGGQLGAVDIKAYLNGGLVNKTGLAWVDGTFDRPEYILKSYDFDRLKEIMSMASTMYKPFMASVNTAGYTQSAMTIGAVNITINEAEINQDYDIDNLAERVGAAFTAQLSSRGFNTDNYTF